MTSGASRIPDRLRTPRTGCSRLHLDAAFWAAAAAVSWAAFRAGQLRLQPEAIATGVPGFLYRLLMLPLELGLGTAAAVPTLVSLQAAAMMTIFQVYMMCRQRTGSPEEGDLGESEVMNE